MRTVGVRELKTHLSRVLKEVQRGEAFLVTDRGQVIAELRQPGAERLSDDPTMRALGRLASEGALRIGEPEPGVYQRSPISAPEGTAGRLLDQERGGEDR